MGQEVSDEAGEFIPGFGFEGGELVGEGAVILDVLEGFLYQGAHEHLLVFAERDDTVGGVLEEFRDLAERDAVWAEDCGAGFEQRIGRFALQDGERSQAQNVIIFCVVQLVCQFVYGHRRTLRYIRNQIVATFSHLSEATQGRDALATEQGRDALATTKGAEQLQGIICFGRDNSSVVFSGHIAGLLSERKYFKAGALRAGGIIVKTTA